MRRNVTLLGGAGGFCYGLSAVILAYPDAPADLRMFIVFGVTAVSAAGGWLAAFFAQVVRER